MKKILIPVKASDELPEDNKFYLTQTIYDIGLMASHEYRRYDHEIKQWEDSLKILVGEQDLIWYKEVSEEEYLRQRMEEINKELEYLRQYRNDMEEIINDPEKMGEFLAGL